jgi:hypothetical protein
LERRAKAGGTQSLSSAARVLLPLVEAEGAVQAIGPAARELEERLLV